MSTEVADCSSGVLRDAIMLYISLVPNAHETNIEKLPHVAGKLCISRLCDTEYCTNTCTRCVRTSSSKLSAWPGTCFYECPYMYSCAVQQRDVPGALPPVVPVSAAAARVRAPRGGNWAGHTDTQGGDGLLPVRMALVRSPATRSRSGLPHPPPARSARADTGDPQ